MSKRRRGRRSLAETASPEALGGVVGLLSELPAATLDLHGLTAAQAEIRIRSFLVTQSRVSPGRVGHIITGKGSRSAGAAVLPSVARDEVTGPSRHLVQDHAGILGGGGFAVRLRRG